MRLMISASSAFHARRLGVFLVVGWLGFALQIAALALLVSVGGWPWLPATVAAVELAVIHNFLWHEGVTWRDRETQPDSARLGRSAAFPRFVRFNLATGMTSIAGNVVLMGVYAGLLGLPPLVANVAAVATMSVLNFVVANRWVFAALLVSACSATLMAAPRSDTLEAWNRYVSETETRIERAVAAPRADVRDLRAEGGNHGVPSGTISMWRGSVFIPGARLDDVLNQLHYPGTPPPQEDVMAAHVISRGADSHRVFIRLVRHAIVTVTYDTEHDMTFRRRSPMLATARSVATRIDEVGGGDRGFLWRLNSYWRYEQVNGGVRVDVESITLSRDVPALVRPIASPIVSQISRESMVRTLEALQRYLTPGSPQPALAATARG
jgi:putative flippase GtrA